MSQVPKAVSVDAQGKPDGFEPELFYRPEVLGGGYTRLVVSAPAERLAAVHRALAAVLQPPLKLLYVQLTDRVAGRQLAQPRQLVAVEVSRQRVLGVLERYALLFFRDGRCQLWLRGAAAEQLVLDELGVLYLYPDDPSFRDALAAEAVPERPDGLSMATRDYVRVNFEAACDAQEQALVRELSLVEWSG